MYRLLMMVPIMRQLVGAAGSAKSLRAPRVSRILSTDDTMEIRRLAYRLPTKLAFKASPQNAIRSLWIDKAAGMTKFCAVKFKGFCPSCVMLALMSFNS